MYMFMFCMHVIFENYIHTCKNTAHNHLIFYCITFLESSITKSLIFFFLLNSVNTHIMYDQQTDSYTIYYTYIRTCTFSHDI